MIEVRGMRLASLLGSPWAWIERNSAKVVGFWLAAVPAGIVLGLLSKILGEFWPLAIWCIVWGIPLFAVMAFGVLTTVAMILVAIVQVRHPGGRILLLLISGWIGYETKEWLGAIAAAAALLVFWFLKDAVIDLLRGRPPSSSHGR